VGLGHALYQHETGKRRDALCADCRYNTVCLFFLSFFFFFFLWGYAADPGGPACRAEAVATVHKVLRKETKQRRRKNPDLIATTARER
jgi:hypothetical protein